jgi:peptidoglycan/xylan/chitin deacetylase (PgdA/CDA1 family)/GT2 family glycosyltransferase
MSGSAVAVVIPCHNLGRTLPAAIESVMDQTRPAAEVVVVDDGSTDVYTRQVLASLAWPRTRVTHTPPRGPAAARNHGIALTEAPYVLTLDADDVLRSTCLERAGARLDEQAELDLVAFGVEGFEEARAVWAPPDLDVAGTLSTVPVPLGFLFRRRLWAALGGFDETLPGYEDLDFWLGARIRGALATTLGEPLLLHRGRADARTRAAARRGAHAQWMVALYRKHWPTVARLTEAVLLAREAWGGTLRAWLADLEHRKRELERELAGLTTRVEELRHTLRARGQPALDWGDLGGLEPTSPLWGLERGQPLDRLYIERFLERHRTDIRGTVLEIQDSAYTVHFGGAAVTRPEVLDVDAGNPRATIVADLTQAHHVPSDRFDCFILTQTLHIIYDIRAALAHAYRVLKPGGVLLCTLPAVSRVNFEDGGLDGGDFWRFTEASVRRLFAEHFPAEAFEVTAHGNVMACCAFLHGLAPAELRPEALEHVDPWLPLLFTVRAVKPAGAAGAGVSAHGARAARPDARRTRRGAVLLYHRVGHVEPDRLGLSVDPEDFRAQLAWLRRQAQPMSLEALLRAAAEDDLPEWAVAVTFDDGYRSAVDTVSPVLAELGIPGTFFVATEGLAEPREFWWDTLERILESDEAVPPALDLRVPGGRWALATATREERAAARRRLHEFLVRATREERDAVLTRLAAWSGLALAPRESHRAMTADEVRRLAGRPGHTIGAHTAHHLLLPAQPEDVQRREVFEGKQALEQCVGAPIRLFAYPYGAASAESAGVVRAAGFAAAVVADGGLVAAGVDPFRAPRVEVTPDVGRRLPALLHTLFAR